MKFENPEDLNGGEKDANLEIFAKLATVDKNAAEVAEEMKEVDMENMDSDDREAAWKKMVMVMAAIMAVGGLTTAYFDVPSHSLQGAEEGFRHILGSRFGIDVGVAWTGIWSFAAAYFRWQAWREDKKENQD
jgi:hypothetical protein